MNDTTTVLAGDFATPTREQWDNEVLKVLNRRRPPGTELTIDKAMARLRTTTVDGLVIEPLYAETDAPALGVPGSGPYTRGTTVRHGEVLAWDVRQLHEDPSVATTNAAVLEDLRVGGTSVWLRVLRRLWSRVGEVLDVPVANRAATQHAVTSWRMITRDDPWVNLLRGTIANFAAAVGGADIVTTLPFDTAQGLPNVFSRRMARNTQLVAAEESNVGRVEDPAGGSWYVETLTDDVAKAAWARVQEIEAAGGMAAALAAGTIASQITATLTERRKRLATRKQPVTGVSMFPPEHETPIENLTVRPASPAPAGLKPVRDAEIFEGLRDRVATHTRLTGSQPGVFLACLGERRDFGPREQFTSNVLLVAGLAHPTSEGGSTDEVVAGVKDAGVNTVILCSSAKVYAKQAKAVAAALKKSGIANVWIAGRKTETGAEDVDSVIDGEVYDGMDVAAFLSDTLDRLGVATVSYTHLPLPTNREV